MNTDVVMLVKVLLAAGFIVYVARQCRKPSSAVGRMLARGMNRSHAGLTRWAMSHVRIEPRLTMLDVGCGGGGTIEMLAGMAAEGRVYGIDYSAASVAVARDRNRRLIEQDRVRIEEGSVASLPVPDHSFDLVTAIETHYYWPDLAHDVREVMRVLKPGGTFAIVAETYRGRRHDWLYRPAMTLLLRAAYLTPEEHRRLLTDAGYGDVEVFEEKAHGWICAIGHA